jgi:hypothetical protein
MTISSAKNSSKHTEIMKSGKFRWKGKIMRDL